MHDDLQQRCEEAFAQHVAMMFERQMADGINTVGAANAKYLVLKAPHIGFLYSACDNELIPKLKSLVCAALARREYFHTTKPAWAPELPINFDDCEKMQNSQSTRMRRLGEFGHSLLLAQWDPAHPEFADWLAAGRRGPDDATWEAWERFTGRLDAGVLRQIA